MNEDVLLEEVLALAEQDGYEPMISCSRSVGHGRTASIRRFIISSHALPPGRAARLRRWSGWPRRWSKRSIGTVPRCWTTGT